MSSIDVLGIIGIRSYDASPNNMQHIELEKPLTLILGDNGTGKTTIIECLKLLTSGSMPPNSNGGRSFIIDPRVAGLEEVAA